MTVDHPVYRFGSIGQPPFKVDGRDELGALYSYWAETNQSIFYAEDETLAVGDNMIISRSVRLPAAAGIRPSRRGVDADEDAMYLMKANIAYDLALRRPRANDRRGRLGVRRHRPRLHQTRRR